VSNALPAPCDALTARNNDGTTPPVHPRLVIATAILASSLALIDSSVVNVGLPAISQSFGTDAVGLQWTVNAYLLPLSALLLLGGAAGDRFGRRRLLIAGVILFGIASLACSVAPTLPFLLFARFVQGASAAMLMPNSLAILGQSFGGEAKGRAIGIWAATGAAAGAVGPVLGGWLIDAGSWRLAFLINVPVSIAAVTLAYRFVDRDVDEATGVLDWSGGALATAGLGFITWALTEGSGRSWSPSIFVFGAVGIVFSITFLRAERRRGDKAMMPLSLFGSPSFVGLTLLTFLLYGALGGLFVLLPYVLIQAGNYTATQAGAALLPLPLIIAIASPAAGALAARIGPRWLLVIGPILVAAGFLLMLRVGSSTSYWLFAFPAITVIAVGMAGAVAPLTTAVLMSVDSHHTGAASGLNSAVARTGGLVATALIGPVIASSGAALISSFEVAAMIGAVISVLAAASAVLVRPTAAVM
jgi:EmrB/QacA subfamily drug resistance transporter